MSGDVVEIGIFADWNGNGLFDHAYSDISGYRLELPEISIGRRSDLQHDEPGRCRIIFDNSTAIFSPENSSSPIYGLMLPNRRIKVTLTYNSTVYTKFNGFLDEIETDIKGNNPENSQAELNAWGPLSQFEESHADVATQSAKTPGYCLGLVLDAENWAGGDRDIDACLTTMLRWWPEANRKTIDIMRALEVMEKGRLHETPDGKIASKARDYLMHSPYNSAQATYDNQTLFFHNIRQLSQKSGICNEYIAKYNTYYKTPASTEILTVTDVENNKGGFPPYVEHGQTETIWVELSGRYKAAESWGSVTKKAFTNSDGTGTELTSDFDVSMTGYGTRAKLVITNSHGSLDGYLTKCIVDGIALIFGDSGERKAGDDTSQGKYGIQSFRKPGQYYAGPIEAGLHGDHVVAKFKDPRSPIQFDVYGHWDSNHLQEILDRNIADRIHVTTTTETGLHINADFVIDHLKYVFGLGAELVMTITCTKVPTDTLAATSTSYTIQETPDPEYIEPGGAADDVTNQSGSIVLASGAQILSNFGFPRFEITGSSISGKDASNNELVGISATTGSLSLKTTASGARIEIDATNGIRGLDASSNVLTHLTTGGVLSLQTAASGAMVTLDSTNGLRGIDAGSNVRCQIKTNGYAYFRQIMSLQSNLRIDIDTDYYYNFENSGNAAELIVDLHVSSTTLLRGPSGADQTDFAICSGGAGEIWFGNSAAASPYTYTYYAKVNSSGIVPATDDTYYLGKNDDDSPAAWKGVILKDTSDGKYYRIQVTNGAVEAIDLTD